MDAQDEYQQGWQDGFNNCKQRIIAILREYPFISTTVVNHLESLHPSQPLTQLGETFEESR